MATTASAAVAAAATAVSGACDPCDPIIAGDASACHLLTKDQQMLDNFESAAR